VQPRVNAVHELLGRDAELSEANKALDAVVSGPIAFVLFGEAGIGKTTVWRQCVTRARDRGYQVLSCQPAESEAGLSFSGLVDLMESVPDRTLRRLPDLQRDALQAALLRRDSADRTPDHAVCMGALSAVRLLAQAGPVVLAVDDAQWLDTPTACVLQYLVRRLGDEPVAILASVRAGDSSAGSEDVPPFGLAKAFGEDRTIRVRLRGLSLGALHRLVRANTGTAWSRPALFRLHQASNGNPFYALEIAHALQRSGAPMGAGQVLPTPRTLKELVSDRIEALPALTRDALLFVAALSHPTVELLQAAMDPAQDTVTALVDAEDSGVLELRDGALRFTHPLLASTVYAMVPAGQRRRVHQRLAEVVGDVEARARHLALAAIGPDPKVSAALEQAAHLAHIRGAPAASAELWELASKHERGAERARLLVRAAECLFVAGDASGARSLIERAVAELPPGPQRVPTLLDLALVVFYEEGPADAVPLCDQALAEHDGDRLLEATAHIRKAWYSLNDHAQRASSARQAWELLDNDDVGAPPDLLALALISLSWFTFLSGGGFTASDIDRARELLPPDSETRESWMVRSALRVFPRYFDPVRGRAEIETTGRLAGARGDESSMMQSKMLLAELDCWLGSWQQSRLGALEAIEAAEQAGQKPWQPYALYALALVDAHLGDLDAAHETAERGFAIAMQAQDSWVGLHQLSVLGFVALSRDDPEAADRYLSEAERLSESVRLGDLGICDLYGDHIEAVTLLGDLDRARQLLARLEQRCRLAPRPWIEAVTFRSSGIVRMAEGDLAGAEEALRQAMDAHDRLPMPFARARTLLVQGRLRRRGKEKLAARDALLAATEIFDRLGARRWSGYAAAELQRLGLRRGPAHDLTPAEERIAQLVASGMSNREVAAAVYVTPKTVEAHLSRIYRKLDVRTRRELARLDFLRPASLVHNRQTP
jgi:DNA-binding CsgD family transcriptional regulator